MGYFEISLHTLKQMSKRYIEKPKQTYGFTVVSNILVYLKLFVFLPVLYLMFNQGFLSEFRSSKAEIH